MAPLLVCLGLSTFVQGGCQSKAVGLAEARAALEAEDWEAACRLHQRLVDSGHQSGEVYIGLAAAQWELGQQATAMETLMSRLLIDPTDRKAHLLIGRWELQNNRKDEAAAHFLSALEFSEYGNQISEAKAWLAQCKSEE